MNEREKYIRRVFETALFFMEMYEENQPADTRAIKLLNPFDVGSVALRKFVLGLYKDQKLSLTEVAVQLGAFRAANKPPAFAVDDIECELRMYCAEHGREIRFVTDEKEKHERAFLRAARYIQRILTEGAPADSRVVESLIPEAFVPRGFGKRGSGHREHVVPCVFLRDRCLDRFKNGATLSEVADFLQRYVVIVEIRKEEQKYLDGSIKNGGLGLKNSMPDDWQLDTGCIFQRLHEANIEFDLPQGFATCNH